MPEKVIVFTIKVTFRADKLFTSLHLLQEQKMKLGKLNVIFFEEI